MDTKVKNDLITKLFDVQKNPKTARLSLNRFIQQATEEDGEQFLDYLTGKDEIKKKIARNIVGQLSVTKALDILITEFLEATDNLTFLPDVEFKENMFYKNLVEILESVFLIIVNEKEKQDHSNFFTKLEEIFKKTKNDDLRFSLIKLIAFLGDRVEHFIKIYPELGDKEKRALFYVYTLKDEKNRMAIYQLGYEEKTSFEFLILNLLKFQDGRTFVNKHLSEANDREKELILKKLDGITCKDFNDTLIELLNSENKFVSDLSKEILLKTLEGSFVPAKFIGFLNTGYSHSLVKITLEIIKKFIKKDLENILLEAFQQQTIHVNKNEILTFTVQTFKQQKKLSPEFSHTIIPIVNEYFETYKPENDEMLVSILKLYTIFQYDHSIQVKTIKTKILRFVKQYENNLAGVVKNKANESVIGLNKIIENLEGNEQKIKTVLNLMEIEPDKIGSDRLVTFKTDLDQLQVIDQKSLDNINNFLFKIYETSTVDWKKRAEAIKILGCYGNKSSIPQLITLEQSEQSFGVKVHIKESIKALKEKYEENKVALVISPLFYINKLITTFFQKNLFQVNSLKAIDKLELLANNQYDYIFVSDSFHDTIDFALLQKMTEKKGGMIVFIISASDPQEIVDKFGESNISILQKPFHDDNIAQVANIQTKA